MILVVGATGNVGGTITRQLLQQGHSVRILVRPKSRYQPLIQAGAQPVFGDLKDPASLAAACQGIDTVVTSATSLERGGEDNPQTVEVEGNRNLIDAAKAAGVRHFVFISTLGVDPNSPIPYSRGKGKAEEHLHNSGMQYTILSPNAYMEWYVDGVVGRPAMAGRPVILVGEGHTRHTFVSADDVAAFAVAAVDNPAAVNQRIVIGGPEALSWHDVIETYEHVLGRTIPVQIGDASMLPADLPETAKAFLPFMETYDSIFDMTETARTFGVNLTTVEEFARKRVESAKS